MEEGDHVSDDLGDLDFSLDFDFLLEAPDPLSSLPDLDAPPSLGHLSTPAPAPAVLISDDDVLPESGGGSPGDSSSQWASDLEKFLLNDDDADDESGAVEGIDEQFHADLFSDLAGTDCAKEDASSCDGERNDKRSGSDDAAAQDGGGDDDPTCKKRRRQVRNRESAMKSRERKKMYVKDLEMKSRFLESECRRLEYALQCCTAENMLLRKSLHEKALGAFAARQESAVLFVESLPLGSLFWLLSVVCLFLLLGPLNGSRDPESVQPTAAATSVRLAAAAAAAERGATNEWLDPEQSLGLVCSRRRRYRACKWRMKLHVLPQLVAALQP